MGVGPPVSGVRLAAAASLLLAACGSPGDDVAPNGSSASCVEPAAEPGDGDYSIVAVSSPMRSPEAPTPAHVRFAADGTILVVDQTRPEVVEAPRTLDEFRSIGRSGPGPGEYGEPRDAVRGPDGTYVVLDRDPPSLVVYEEDGSYREEIRLWAGAWALAADEDAVYVSSWVTPRRYEGRGRGEPVLGRVRLDGPEPRVDTLLQFRPEWRGEPPIWHLPGALTFPRVGRDGELYLAWSAGYEVWRVDEGGHRAVVRGCIPEDLMEGYRDESGGRRTVARFISDFAVGPNGEVIVRGGHPTEDRQLRRQVFSSDGELRESWALSRDDSVFTEATLDPDSAGYELTWSRGSGDLRLLRFEGGR